MPSVSSSYSLLVIDIVQSTCKNEAKPLSGRKGAVNPWEFDELGANKVARFLIISLAGVKFATGVASQTRVLPPDIAA
jgi:hypothetical protein